MTRFSAVAVAVAPRVRRRPDCDSCSCIAIVVVVPGLGIGCEFGFTQRLVGTDQNPEGGLDCRGVGKLGHDIGCMHAGGHPLPALLVEAGQGEVELRQPIAYEDHPLLGLPGVFGMWIAFGQLFECGIGLLLIERIAIGQVDVKYGAQRPAALA